MKSYSLQLVKPLPADEGNPVVQARLGIASAELGPRLRLEYEVRGAKLNARPQFPKDQPVWNLWDLDVCEVFVSSAQEEGAVAAAPYFEFQVSPFGQYFELKVFEPRQKADQTFRSGLVCGADVKTTQAWNAWIEIPLSALGLDPAKPIYGGLFACLLRAPHRAYLASHLPPQQKPDFHIPAHFASLL